MKDAVGKFLQAQKIAVIRTDRLGDMVLTLPLCRAIKKEFPEKHLTLIAGSYTEPLLRDCPVADYLIFVDTNDKSYTRKVNEQFDAVFFPRPRLSEALWAWRKGIPMRIGSAYRWYSFLFNHKVREHRKSAGKHEAEYNVSMLGSITGRSHETALVRPSVNPSALEAVKQKLFARTNGDDFIIIHPGSGGSARDVAPEVLAEAGNEIGRLNGKKIIITGSSAEADKCALLAAQCPGAVNIAGEFDLTEMIALLSMAKLLIANSTGILHIAAALGVPVAGLYPNTPHLSARRWGPYTQSSRIISPPLTAPDIDDMSLVSGKDIADAAMELLAEHPQER